MAACLYMLFTSSINPEREKPMTPSTHYYCKYCGKKFPSIQVMVGGLCVNHPKGSNKGGHAPAL